MNVAGVVGIELAEHALALQLHRQQPAGHHGVEEVLPAAEVVVDRGVVALARRLRDVTQRHLEPALGDEPLGGVEQRVLRPGTTIHGSHPRRSASPIKRMCLTRVSASPPEGCTMTAAEQVREIDAGTPITRFARGWHCLGLAESFRDGEPHGINAFGTRLVVFADSDGEIHVLDGYCRHMGGDLSMGTIKGDTVACPFHDWRWQGSTGRCVEVPYARRTPRLARTRKWLCQEVNGQLLVWHDPEGSTPPAGADAADYRGLRRGQVVAVDAGTRSSSRARTAARSSTTTSTWRTSSTSTAPIRRTSRTSSRARPPASSWSPRRAPTPRRTTKSCGRERIYGRRPPTSDPPT